MEMIHCIDDSDYRLYFFSTILPKIKQIKDMSKKTTNFGDLNANLFTTFINKHLTPLGQLILEKNQGLQIPRNSPCYT